PRSPVQAASFHGPCRIVGGGRRASACDHGRRHDLRQRHGAGRRSPGDRRLLALPHRRDACRRRGRRDPRPFRPLRRRLGAGTCGGRAMSDAEGPMQAARKLMRPDLPRRFYKCAEAAGLDGAFTVVLDGRPVRTPAKSAVSVPTEELALALAAEWNAQVKVIDPATMPLTRIVNSAIDGVAREADAVRAEIEKYAGSDLLCYRAEGPERLVLRQREVWDPVLEWARDEL